MKKVLLVGFGLMFAAVLTSCGGKGQTQPGPISVSISPTSTNVEAGTTAQFTATVSKNTSTTAVTWQVNGVTGGTANSGTISASGLYTAPVSVASTITVTVTAVSQADSSKTASASVTVTPAIVVAISPGSVTVAAGATQQFTATVQNTSNTAVNWLVNDVPGGNASLGTISATGLYTAPLSPPPMGGVHLLAVSLADASKWAIATVGVTFANASLQGQYAFSITTYDSSGATFSAGTFTADGNGNITSGTEDVNSPSILQQELALSGTYSIGPDGRGTAIVSDSAGGTSTFTVSLRSNGGGRFVESDTTVQGSGTFELQDQTAFVASALNGVYVFRIDGEDASTAGPFFFAEVGAFTANGAGTISAGSADVNRAGTIGSSTFTGAYTVGSNGRGTVSLTDGFGTVSNFAMYVISAGRVTLVSLDHPDPRTSGIAEKQSGTFSNASLKGDFVFGTAGESTLGTVYDVGRFTADGSGGISAGVFDENDTGTVLQNVALSGAYTITANGRGTAMFFSSAGTTQYIFYLVSPGRAYLLANELHVADGDVFPQQTPPFSTSSVHGSYAFGLLGASRIGLLDIVGQLSADGAGNFLGTRDVTEGGTLTADLPFAGAYSVSSNGRGTATLTDSLGTRHFQFYLLSDSSFLLLGVDTTEYTVGVADKQF